MFGVFDSAQNRRLQTVERGGFPAAGEGEGGVWGGGFFVGGAGVQGLGDEQGGRLKKGRQEAGGTQAEVFGEVGHDEPDFAVRVEVCRRAVQEAAQHGVAGVVEGGFDGGCGFGGQPGRVAEDEVGASFGEEVGFLYADVVCKTEAADVGAGAGEGAGVVVGGGDAGDAALGEQGGEDAGACADVEGRLKTGMGGGLCDKVEIFAAYGGKHAEGDVDFRAERGDVYAFFVPFVRADEAEQQVEGEEEGGGVRAGFAVEVGEGGTDVGGAGEAEGEARADFDGEHVGEAALLRLPQAVAVEGGGGVGGLFVVFRRPVAAHALFQGGQNLFGVVVVAGEDGGGVGAGVLQHGGGVGFAGEDGVFRRLLRAFAAPFVCCGAVGGDLGVHGRPSEKKGMIVRICLASLRGCR